MADLIAHKRLSYAGRNIRPGVVFSANPAHARVLVAAGVAGFAREQPQPVTASYTLQKAADPINDLRAAYAAKAGKPPDSRWREKRLTKEIAAL
jgi:hypothetical protein